MRREIALLSAIGCFAFLAAASAQAPAPATAFDGTYQLASAAQVNKTYTTRKGQTIPCPARRAGPLKIVNGRAEYRTATAYRVHGSVGPQGELAMRAIAPADSSQPIEMIVHGSIDGAGTARARQLGHSCSYDFVWQKVSR